MRAGGEKVEKGEVERALGRAERILDSRALAEIAGRFEVGIQLLEVVLAGEFGFDEMLAAAFERGELGGVVEFEVEFAGVEDVEDDGDERNFNIYSEIVASA